MLKWPAKDPDEVLDYTIQWGNRLPSDTITSSTWIIPNSINKESDSFDTKSTTIWLSGGTSNTVPLTITNRVVTAGNRTMDQSVSLLIQDK